jgi:transposase
MPAVSQPAAPPPSASYIGEPAGALIRLSAMRTRQINRLRWHLHQLDPDLEHATRRLPGPGLCRLAAWLAQATPSVQVGICRDQVTAIGSLTDQIGQLDRQLRPARHPAGAIPAQPARLRAADRGQAHRRNRRGGPVPLRGLLCHTRWRSPGPGQLRPYRPPPGGNRQLNAALHRIAITQLRRPGPGQAYYQRRRAQGDGTGEAVRALKRRIARAVYQRLRAGQSLGNTVHTAA